MNVDSENNNLKVENVNFVKMNKIALWQKIFILFFLCFSFLMYFIYALFTKYNNLHLLIIDLTYSLIF